MHIPDGFIDAPTSLAFGVVAAGGVAYCLRRGSAELDERAAPLAGLTAAFVFAAQMLNFPVAAGTSGHLLGGALAAVLVGPWIGAACVAVVLLLQSLFFADGGLSALGLNVFNMALLSGFAGYLIFRGLLRVMPRRSSVVPLAAGIAAGLSVPIAALGFVGQFAIGGTVEDLSLRTVAGAMIGVHLLIGLGEGLITALTVGLVMSSRPDLVHGARDLRRTERARALAADPPAAPARPAAPAAPAASAAPAPAPVAPAAAPQSAAAAGRCPCRAGRRPAVRRPAHPPLERRRHLMRSRTLLLVGMLVAFLLAGFVSGWASSAPDGLNKVAIDQGFAPAEDDHALADLPLAGYAVRGIENERLAGGLAGVIGVAMTFAVGGALFLGVSRLGRARRRDGDAPEDLSAPGPAADVPHPSAQAARSSRRV